jgi:hypothetical protein
MLKWTLVIVAALTLLVVAVAVIGWLLPAEHHATRAITVRAAPADVFLRITDVTRAPEWRTEVRAVEAVSGSGLGMTFREVGSHGAIPYRVLAWEPDRRWVTEIADPTLPFGGTWTFWLEPADGATRVTITEDGVVRNPIFRFLSRFVFSPTATIERYQAALVASVGPVTAAGSRAPLA